MTLDRETATREFFRLHEELRLLVRFRHRSRMGSSLQRARYNYIRTLCNKAREFRQMSGYYPQARGPKQQPSRASV